MTTQDTRARILDAALRLFNESGTAAVSTNHIASAARISPGNLYYHFRNKEEIIRALVEQLFAAFDALWRAEEVRPLSDLLHTVFTLQWRYRFFHRELVALLRHDAVLAQRYQAIYRQRLQQIPQGARVADMATTDETTLSRLLTASWIISENWLTFLESTGQPMTDEHWHEGADVISALFRPYLRSHE